MAPSKRSALAPAGPRDSAPHTGWPPTNRLDEPAAAATAPLVDPTSVTVVASPEAARAAPTAAGSRVTGAATKASSIPESASSAVSAARPRRARQRAEARPDRDPSRRPPRREHASPRARPRRRSALSRGWQSARPQLYGRASASSSAVLAVSRACPGTRPAEPRPKDSCPGDVPGHGSRSHGPFGLGRDVSGHGRPGHGPFRHARTTTRGGCRAESRETRRRFSRCACPSGLRSRRPRSRERGELTRRDLLGRVREGLLGAGAPRR